SPRGKTIPYASPSQEFLPTFSLRVRAILERVRLPHCNRSEPVDALELLDELISQSLSVHAGGHNDRHPFVTRYSDVTDRHGRVASTPDHIGVLDKSIGDSHFMHFLDRDALENTERLNGWRIE